MKILFAAADRDLLGCYETLLRTEDRQVDTAFDGAQVLRKLSQGDYDLLVLSRTIPRVPEKTILAQCLERRLPVIVLLPEPLRTGVLTGPVLANAYLPLPFLPEELTALISDVWETCNAGGSLRLEGLEADLSAFLLETAPITMGEINVLKKLAEGASPDPEQDAVCIRAINAKLARMGLPHRIRYHEHKGYRMVNENEQS